MSLYFCHTYFENLKLFWSDIIWLSLHFQWICTKKSTLISITRVIFNKRLYIWRSNHYKTNYCKETNFVCGTVIVSRDARRSENLGGLVPSIIKRSFDRAGFSLHFSKIWGSSDLWGEGGNCHTLLSPSSFCSVGPAYLCNFEDCPFQLTFGTYKRGLQNQSELFLPM